MQHGRDRRQKAIDFEGNYSPAEMGEMVTATQPPDARPRHDLTRQLEYIRSAAKEDAYRNEPAFKLQGCYRNMKRIAEKVLALMSGETRSKRRSSDHYETNPRPSPTARRRTCSSSANWRAPISERRRCAGARSRRHSPATS